MHGPLQIHLSYATYTYVHTLCTYMYVHTLCTYMYVHTLYGTVLCVWCIECTCVHSYIQVRIYCIGAYVTQEMAHFMYVHTHFIYGPVQHTCTYTLYIWPSTAYMYIHTSYMAQYSIHVHTHFTYGPVQHTCTYTLYI